MKNMTNKKIAMWSLALFLFVIILSITPLVYAQISYTQNEAVRLKNASITEAIVNKNYDQWASLVTDKRLKSMVNASNFNSFADAYLLLEQGKVAEASIVKQQVGLKETYTETVTKNSLIKEALDNNNYTVWRELVGPNYEARVNIGNFQSYASASKLMSRGLINQALTTLYSVGLSNYTPSSR